MSLSIFRRKQHAKKFSVKNCRGPQDLPPFKLLYVWGLFSCILKGKEAPNINNLQGQGSGGGVSGRGVSGRGVSGESLYALLGGHFGPEKKIFSRPPPPKFPNSPQTPSRPLRLLENTPLLGISIKIDPPPPPGASDSPFPFPEQKK